MGGAGSEMAGMATVLAGAVSMDDSTFNITGGAGGNGGDAGTGGNAVIGSQGSVNTSANAGNGGASDTGGAGGDGGDAAVSFGSLAVVDNSQLNITGGAGGAGGFAGLPGQSIFNGSNSNALFPPAPTSVGVGPEPGMEDATGGSAALAVAGAVSQLIRPKSQFPAWRACQLQPKVAQSRPSTLMRDHLASGVTGAGGFQRASASVVAGSKQRFGGAFHLATPRGDEPDHWWSPRARAGRARRLGPAASCHPISALTSATDSGKSGSGRQQRPGRFGWETSGRRNSESVQRRFSDNSIFDITAGTGGVGGTAGTKGGDAYSNGGFTYFSKIQGAARWWKR